MIKFVSLLKAMFSQDMNFFKYKTNNNSSKIKKVLFPLFLGIIVMFAVGTYAYMFAEPLSKIGLTYVMLTLFMIIVTVVTFMEGMYKSQGILFDCKDNDLLFSLPIHKSKIFALRVIKLLVFQFIYNLFCILPAYAMYIYFETPSINFYVISILMLFLLPIIPTVISVILGYIVKGISSKFKAKKIIQTVLSLILFLGIFFLSYNLENIIANLTQKATSINDALTKIYYPVGAYINLIQIMILSDLIFIIKFDLSLADTLLILAFTLIIPIVTAILGLIINLKYPKMNASSDTEVVKQSMSTMISVFIGMFIFAVSTLVMIKGFEYINLIIPIELGIFIVILVTLWLILKNYGNKRIREINV